MGGTGGVKHQVHASQQLKNVAKQVAIQAGNTVRLSPKKVSVHRCPAKSSRTNAVLEFTY